MTDGIHDALRRAGLACRAVAVCLLSGWLTGRDFADVDARLASRPLGEQATIVAAVLVALFLAALLAAQAGVVGLCLYGVAVVVLAR